MNLTARTNEIYEQLKLVDRITPGRTPWQTLLRRAEELAAAEMPTETKTTFIGGTMYGDGEYVVEFLSAGSSVSPMRAAVMTPSSRIYNVEQVSFDRPSVKLAAEIIAQVRREEDKR